MHVVLAAVLAFTQVFSISVTSVERNLASCVASNGYTIDGNSGRITYQTNTSSGGGWGPKKRVVIERIWADEIFTDPETGEQFVAEYVSQFSALSIYGDGRATGCFREGFPGPSTFLFSKRYEAWVALFSDWYTPLSSVESGSLQ